MTAFGFSLDTILHDTAGLSQRYYPSGRCGVLMFQNTQRGGMGPLMHMPFSFIGGLSSAPLNTNPLRYNLEKSLHDREGISNWASKPREPSKASK